MSIALNSTTKFRTRLLPTLEDYVRIEGKLPLHLVFAFAALCLFHKGKRGDETIALKDDPALLEHWTQMWTECGTDYKKFAKQALSWKEAWETDMNAIHPALADTVAGYLEAMEKKGMRAAVEEFVNG